MRYLFKSSLCASVLLCGLAWAAPQEFRLEKPFDVRVELDSQNRNVRLRVLTPPELEVTVGQEVHKFPLETWLEEMSPGARGAVLVADFDFDGRKDLGIPSAVGYGGVNVFYDVYRYQNGWQPIKAIQGDFAVSNPSFAPEQKTLVTNSRSGPFWYGLDYKFSKGRAWVYRRRNPVLAAALLKDQELLTHFEVLDPKGRIVSSRLSSDPDQQKPVRGVLSENVFLYPLPGSRGGKGFLHKGDTVIFHEVTSQHGGRYARVSCGSGYGWILLPKNP